MYFWHIEKVREQLASGAISERTGFKYFMAHIVLYSLAYVPIFETEPFDYAVGLLLIPITVGGVLYAHRSNGGYEGENFYTKLFTISWVMTVKLLVAIVVYFALFGFFTAAAGGKDDLSYNIAKAVLFTLFMLVYYWRIGVHIRHTNQLIATGPVPPEPDRESAEAARS